MRKGKAHKNSAKNKVKRKKKKNATFLQFKSSHIFKIALITLLGIIIYSTSFQCSFHFDDFNNIVDNPVIRNLDIKSLWTHSPNRFIPFYSFAINYHLGELNVWGYHFINLVIHLINACLVYWLTFFILSSPALQKLKITNDKKLIAFFTALLFVSHPLATQSVTYIVQRMASMVAMFYLLSLFFYLNARLKDRQDISQYIYFSAAIISAVLALLTKENAFTLPFAILLIEFSFFQRKKVSINLKDNRVILISAVILIFFIFLLSRFSFNVFDPIPPKVGNSYTVTPINYLLTQFSVIIKYIQLLFLPINQNLDYDFPISNSLFELRTLLSLFTLLFLLSLALFFFKKKRIISFGILWFFLTLSIESSIIPITDLIFEHRTYLPSYGFFLILSTGIYSLLWKKYKYPAIALFMLIVGLNSILTFERNKIWKDEMTLWSDVIEKSPNKARPFVLRGLEYRKHNQTEQSRDDFSRAIEINPSHYAPSYNNRGITYKELGEWDKALSDYTKAIELDSNYWSAYINRAIIFGNLKKWSKAITDYSTSIDLDSNYTLAYNNRGVAHLKLKNWDEALHDYSKAIELDPDDSEKYDGRGIAFRNKKKWDLALLDFTKSIKLKPNYAPPYINRGVTYGSLKQWDNALADFTKAVQLDPNSAIAKKNLDIVKRKVTRK